MNPWHDVPAGPDAPHIVQGVIEIPQGSKAKYELDKESGLLRLDRVLYSSVNYPANYGFIPQTYCDDKDPLDILVLSQIELQPLCLVRAKVIGVMHMVDGGEADDKVIAVAADDVSVRHIESLDGLPPHFQLELRQFFEDYKKLEHGTVTIESFHDAETARGIVLQAMEDYRTYISKGI